MGLINAWELEKDFWKIYPELALIPEFKEIKQKYKSHSSRYMWAVALYSDFDSKFRILSESERRTLISKEYLKEPKFNWKTLQPAIDAWKFKYVSPAKKQLLLWERFMQEKNEYMSKLTYTKSTAKEITEELLSNKKLFEEYERLSSLIGQEDGTGRPQGGGEESLSEKGDI